jgi:leucyl aminopeptidase
MNHINISIINQFPQAFEKSLIAVIVTQENVDFLKSLWKNFPQNPEIFTKEKSISIQPNENECIVFQGYQHFKDLEPEKFRQHIFGWVTRLNKMEFENLYIYFPGIENHPQSKLLIRSIAEVPILSNYQYIHLKTKKEWNSLKNVYFVTENLNWENELNIATNVANSTCIARDLVNDPPNLLDSVILSQKAIELGKKFGFRVEVFEKSRIESLKMGGLLSVNLGSKVPPTFSILEWKPEHPKNDKPIVLVGKGITFDTGGLSLKPFDAMSTMKCDMAGAAAVLGAMCAITSNNLPYHVIGLIPSTDNRPGENAYTPNDVITIYDGTTVEVLNTDAEGRLILADALAFANQYEPELIIDLATLTGAAVVAVGDMAIAMMSTANHDVTEQIIKAGFEVHERMVQFPLWDEYKELIKSDIADLKNVGPRSGGAITAAKFLQHFVKYPWIHLDIAGPAFLNSPDSYRGKNGTGVGVRLLYHFLETYEHWNKSQN